VASKNKLIIQQHDIYKENISYVDLALRCYMNRGFLEKALYKHKRETSLDFEERCKRTIHLNFFKMYIDLYFKVLFGSDGYVERNFGKYKNILIPYEENLDGKGTQADNFFKQLGVLSLITKVAYAFIDLDNDTGEVFVKSVSFEDVIDWYKDKYGNYDWVVIKYDIFDEYTPFTEHKSEKRYLLYDEKSFQWYESDGSIISGEGANHGYGLVPLVPLCLRDVDFDMVGDSFSESLLECDIQIMNYMSLHDEEVFQNAFNLLMLPELDTGIRINTTTGEREKTPIDLSTKRAVIMKGLDDNAFKPTFLTPDLSTMKDKREMINFLLDRMADIAGFKAKGSATSSYQSGISMIMDYTNTYETIIQIANQMENFECKVWYDVYKVHPNTLDVSYDEFIKEIKITYPRNYNIIDVSKKIEELYTFIDHADIHGYSPTAKAEAVKQLVSEQLSLSADLEKRVYKEIEKHYKEELKQEKVTEEPKKEEQEIIETIPEGQKQVPGQGQNIQEKA